MFELNFLFGKFSFFILMYLERIYMRIRLLNIWKSIVKLECL